MQPRSFDELAREWGSQTKDFLTLLGDLVTQRIKEKLPMIIGGGVYGAISVTFAFFLLGWLTVAGYQELIARDFTPSIAALLTGAGCLGLSLLSLVTLKFHLTRVRHKAEDHGATISEAGRDLLELSKDVAKSTLTPKVILKEQAGKILAASVVFGFLVGMAAEKSTPEAKR